MAGKDHKALAMIFGLGPKKGGEPPPSEDDPTDGEDSGLPPPSPEFADCCREAMHALKAGDEQGFCESLWHALHVFDAGEDAEGGEEPEGGGAKY